jgi:flagellar secretion chaperone FliS
LAQNLSSLYEYMARRLMLANVQNDVGPVNEVLSLMNEIRSAWIAIGPEVRNVPNPPKPTVSAGVAAAR